MGRRVRAGTVKREPCGQCGKLCEPAEYHPYEFCVLVKGGVDPWPAVRRMSLQLTGADPGEKPPHISQLLGGL